jgi:hypothetical protein
VQAQRQRACAGFQQPEFQAVRPYPARPYLHPLTLPAGKRRPERVAIGDPTAMSFWQ